MRTTSILFISHCSVVERYRRRFELLAQYVPDCSVSVLLPATWWEGGGFCAASEKTAGNLRILVRRAVFERTHRQHAHFYPSLHGVLRETRPDIVYLDEEPYSLVSAHTAAALALHNQRARLIFCTYENLTFDEMHLSPARRLAFETCRRLVFARAGAAQAVTRGAAEALVAQGFHGLVFVLPAIGYPPPARLGPIRQPGEPLRVGYLGRLEVNKGIDTLVRAAALTAGVQLTIGGDGSEGPALRNLARHSGAGDRIVFHGRVGHEELQTFLSLLHVLVLPSRTMPGWKEQYGRVLVEAMAHGVIPIGSDCGAIPEVIGDAGRTFPEGDAGALAAILCQLHLDRHWEPLRECAMRRAQTHFSDERVALGYAGVLAHWREGRAPASAASVPELVWVRP